MLLDYIALPFYILEYRMNPVTGLFAVNSVGFAAFLAVNIGLPCCLVDWELIFSNRIFRTVRKGNAQDRIVITVAIRVAKDTVALMGGGTT